jgi:hypothetical protein
MRWMIDTVSPASTTTTTTGPSARGAAANVLTAVVFREILAPLAAGLGPLGEMAAGSVADAIFARPKR